MEKRIKLKKITSREIKIILIFILILFLLNFFYTQVPDPRNIVKSCAMNCTYDNFNCIREQSLDAIGRIGAQTTCMYSLRECIGNC